MSNSACASGSPQRPRGGRTRACLRNHDRAHGRNLRLAGLGVVGSLSAWGDVGSQGQVSAADTKEFCPAIHSPHRHAPYSLAMSLVPRAARRLALLLPAALIAFQRSSRSSRRGGRCRPDTPLWRRGSQAEGTTPLDLPRPRTFRKTRNGCSARCQRVALRRCGGTACAGPGFDPRPHRRRSLYERDSERGYATCSSICCSVRANISTPQAIPTWQRLGATFGSDTNAETSPTHTVFKLDCRNTAAKVERA